MKKANKKIFDQKVREAKKTFPSHRKIRLRIKQNPVNPFNSATMDKFIHTRDIHPEYDAYIHEDYMSIRYINTDKKISAPLRIDDKLWIELLSVFELVPMAPESD